MFLRLLRYYRVLDIVAYWVSLGGLTWLLFPGNASEWADVITISSVTTAAFALFLEVVVLMIMSGYTRLQNALAEGRAQEREKLARTGAMFVEPNSRLRQGAVISVAKTEPQGDYPPLVVLTINDNAFALSIEDAEQIADDVPKTGRLQFGDLAWEMPEDAANRISVALWSMARKARDDLS